MSRLTASIALLTYVLGGWLLPALHHHAEDACEHSSVTHSSATHGEDLAAKRHACACPSETGSPEWETMGSPHMTAAPAVSLEECAGFCLLCQLVEQTFSVDLSAPSIAGGDVSCVVRAGHVSSGVTMDWLGIDCPRGPPARLV